MVNYFERINYTLQALLFSVLVHKRFLSSGKELLRLALSVSLFASLLTEERNDFLL